MGGLGFRIQGLGVGELGPRRTHEPKLGVRSGVVKDDFGILNFGFWVLV